MLWPQRCKLFKFNSLRQAEIKLAYSSIVEALEGGEPPCPGRSIDSTLLNILMGLFYVLSLVVVLFSLIAGSSTPSRLIIYIVFLVGFLGVAYYLNTFNKKI